MLSIRLSYVYLFFLRNTALSCTRKSLVRGELNSTQQASPPTELMDVSEVVLSETDVLELESCMIKDCVDHDTEDADESEPPEEPELSDNVKEVDEVDELEVAFCADEDKDVNDDEDDVPTPDPVLTISNN